MLPIFVACPIRLPFASNRFVVIDDGTGSAFATTVAARSTTTAAARNIFVIFLLPSDVGPAAANGRRNRLPR